DSFIKITNQTLKKHFSSSTILNEMFQVQKSVVCFKLCSRRNSCEYLKYQSENCSLYLSLSFNENLEDGNFWYKNNNDMIFADCTTSTGTAILSNFSLLATNYPVSNLTNLGFQIVYDQFYSNSTIYSDLTLLRNYCNPNSILCAGGGLANSDILLLVACGNCYQILTNTTKNSPKLVGSVYWYMTIDYSFGFSPSSTINQNRVDTYSLSDPLRLSWFIDSYSGGWRLGTITNLFTSTMYKKGVTNQRNFMSYKRNQKS
ncbi:unnamed protein product, partial [Brachionus calyciflorus]